MHPVLRLEHMGSIEAVLAAGPWDQAIVLSVIAAIPVTKSLKLLLARRPVDGLVFLLGELASIANAFVVEMNRRLLGSLGVLILDRRVGALVRDHASPAELDLTRQSVLRIAAKR